jgi:hypothetical protein
LKFPRSGLIARIPFAYLGPQDVFCLLFDEVPGINALIQAKLRPHPLASLVSKQFIVIMVVKRR